MEKIKKFSKIIGLILFAIVFYFAGYLVGHKNLVFEEGFKPKVANMELLKPREVDFAPFWKAWEAIQEKYVGTSDAQKMLYGAISGLINSLEDPYSMFMEPDFSKTFMEDLSGEIQGIGAEISLKNKQLTIVSPLSGSPAEKAGLKPNDRILKINDDLSDGFTLDEAIQKIRGAAGTKVKLTIMREGWAQAQVFEITRAKVLVRSVEWSIKEGKIGYIKISQFGDDTVPLVREASAAIKAQNPRSIILDLRRNPGGYLDAAIDVASLFMKEGVVAKEKYKDGHVSEEKTTLQQIFDQEKIIVLVDGGSASASEIVAGALQDVKRATIVGKKTFGKGSVQELIDLGDSSTLRLTIAKWLTPSDREINGEGVNPDIEIDLSEEDSSAGRDPQLEKAMELAR